MSLDERKTAILTAVVREYIETAQPVGSSHVARAGVEVSPATIRNEMAVLERDGYLTHPHTSAGRVPTDKGYRVFVDQLTSPGALRPAQRQLVRDFFTTAHGELEKMLQDTSSLLSRLTDYAAVVVAPPAEPVAVRSVQLVALSPSVVLVVAVLANGAVVKRTLELDTDVSEERVAAAGAHVSAHTVGHSLGTAPTLPLVGDKATDRLVAAAAATLTTADEADADHVFVGGASRMAAAFDAVDTVRRVLGLLEQQFVVVTLVREVLDRGLSVSIGTEHGVRSLAECAVVVAPYPAEGEAAGAIGVLGPTRMNYPQAMAAVAVVSERLGDRLTEG